MLKLGRLVGARLTSASDAQGAGGLRLDAVFFEKAPGRRRAARTALARERLFAVAEVFQNVSAQASLVVAVVDHPPQLPLLGGGPRRQLFRVDAQGPRRRRVEQANASPLKGRVGADQTFRLKRPERPAHLRVAQAELRGDGFQVELRLFALVDVAREDQVAQHAALVRIVGEGVERHVNRHLHQRQHRRLAGATALDVAGLFQHHERRVDRHVVLDAQAFTQLARRQLDALLAERGDLVIDALDQFGRRVAAFDEELLRARVGVVEQQDAIRRQPVAARAPDLLIVGFDGAGQMEMRHEADVGFIDAHAEGVSGDDGLRVAVHESVLRAAALGVVHAAVIELDAKAGEL